MRIASVAVGLALALVGCGRVSFDAFDGDGSTGDGAATGRALSAGKETACLVRVDGSVVCWGENRFGQLGSGAGNLSALATVVQGLANIETVDVGGAHACALDAAGAVWCWGFDTQSQSSGAVPATGASVPVVRVALPGPAVAISAGGETSCAVLESTALYCWGWNLYGQIGVAPPDNVAFPVTQVLADGVTAVSAGGTHTCAIRNGTAWCWGVNLYGQLGDGTLTQQSFPIDSGISAEAIAVAANHTCILSGGRYRCWGSNGDGESSGTGPDNVAPPGPLSQLDRLTQIRAGAFHTCVRRDDGTGWCWGNNEYGALGTTPGIDSASPIETPVSSLLEVAAGREFTCVLPTSGPPQCWGQANRGQTGEPERAAQPRPQVVTLPAAASTVAVGVQHTCAIVGPTRELWCWGVNIDNQVSPLTDRAVASPRYTGRDGVDEVSLGRHHTCDRIGSVVSCWGNNTGGQLGNNSTTSSATPVTVAGTWSQVAVGDLSSCARSGGTVSCWGVNDDGPVGDGGGGSVLAPQAVTGVTAAVTINVGKGHACVITGGNNGQCWGSNREGQLGNGTSGTIEVVQNVMNLNTLSTVRASYKHTCGTTFAGELYCWGANVYGAFGSASPDQTVPLQIIASGVSELSVGTFFGCAILDGVTNCWGDNGAGQLGDGSFAYRDIPLPVAGLTTPLDVAAGDAFACGVSATGAVSCWGESLHGQLGTGALGYSSLPVTVTLP